MIGVTPGRLPRFGLAVIAALVIASTAVPVASQASPLERPTTGGIGGQAAMIARIVQNGGTSRLAVHGSGSSAIGVLEAGTLGPPGRRLFQAKITCLEVSDNDGIASAVVDRSYDPAFPVGERMVAEGVDNSSNSSGASVSLWRISFQPNGGIIPDDAPGCWLPVLPPVPIQSGRVVVVD